MRTIIVLFSVLIAACAGQPPAPTGIVQTPVVKASQPLARNLPIDSNGKIDPEAMANAKKLGFTPVNQDGQVLYCRTDLKTGSRVERETVCMTLAEVDALREQTKEQMNDFTRRSLQAAPH